MDDPKRNGARARLQRRYGPSTATRIDPRNRTAALYPVWTEICISKGIYCPRAGQQREKRRGIVLQLPEIQEFVAEARERNALMTTRRARRYQRGSICKSRAPGAPQKRVQLGRVSEMDEKQARIGLDDIVALLNRNPAHALGAEPVRRFVEQVYIPRKYENGDWRKASG